VSPDSHSWPVKVYRHTKDRGWEVATCDTILSASPCVGGVELRQLRVRIRIFPKNKEDTEKVTTNTTRCSKRRNLLFLSTRRDHSGSIVLKFQDLQACNAFFDELTKLNFDKIRNFDKRNVDEQAKSNGLEEDEERLSNQRKRDTLDYLIRLLNDEGFGHFVNQMEKSLTSTEDGAKMLKAFQSSRLGEDENNGGK